MRSKLFEKIDRIQGLMGIVSEGIFGNNIETVIFISGLLDRGEGFDKQTSRVKESSSGRNVISFKYNESDSNIQKAITNNPNCVVIMFSAGANKALMVTNTIKDKSKAFVIEPVCGNKSTKQAVSNGLPAKNVFVGNSCANGKGIVPGTSSSDASGHFAAINSVLKKILSSNFQSSSTDTKVPDSEVNAYFTSNSVDEKKEEKIEKQYGKSKCKANSNYTDGPKLESISKDKVIRIGHKGEGVSQIQLILQKLGYDLGRCGVDGIFGKMTKRAIEKFQQDNNITVSSSIDPTTLETLQKGPKSLKKSSGTDIDRTKTVVKAKNIEVISKDQYDMYKFTGYVICIPKNYKSKNAHVLFCGKSTSATSSIGALYTDAVNPLLNRVAVVITHSYHGGGGRSPQSFANQVNTVQSFLKTNGFNLIINSVAGFSRGGNIAWQFAGPRSDMKFVGLIDPSTTETDLDLGNNTIMECNPNVWSGNFRSNLKWYCDHKDDSKYKNKVFCVTKSHAGIMKTFYQNYGSRI